MLKRGVQPGKPGIVTSGTGSGKTESFLLPLFAQLTKELDSWEEPADRIPTQDSWWKERSLGGLTPSQIYDNSICSLNAATAQRSNEKRPAGGSWNQLGICNKDVEGRERQYGSADEGMQSPGM